jgi:transcriptional repressor NrdR
VVDSRDSETGAAIRRRRECLKCGNRFTTYERVETMPLWVVKKDGRREEFDRQKLLSGLLNATKKTTVTPSQVEALVENMENELRSLNLTEVSTGQIGELVMQKLHGIDEVAYVRFASVYRGFKDVQDMRNTIETLLAQAPGIRPKEMKRKQKAEEPTPPLF